MFKWKIVYRVLLFFSTMIILLTVLTACAELSCKDTYMDEHFDKIEMGYYEDESEQPDIGTENNIIEIFRIGNIEQVYNGGTPPTFTLNKSYHVTELWSYHWNDGRGAPAGTLALKTKDGQSFGPWPGRISFCRRQKTRAFCGFY